MFKRFAAAGLLLASGTASAQFGIYLPEITAASYEYASGNRHHENTKNTK